MMKLKTDNQADIRGAFRIKRLNSANIEEIVMKIINREFFMIILIDVENVTIDINNEKVENRQMIIRLW